MNHKSDHRPTIYITFSEASLNIITSAISNGELSGSCILIAGNWHLGPLRKRTTQTLAAWFSKHIGYVPDNVVIDDSTATIKRHDKTCAWVNTTSSEEYANFLHWASTCKLQSISLIRFSDNDTLSEPFGIANVARLIDTALETAPQEISLYTQEWAKLVDENSDFRLIDPSGKIQSFTSSHFDRYITDAISISWKSSPEVVLHIMETLDAERQSFPGDIFLYHRIEKFVASGIVEKQTDSDVTRTKIRSVTR